MKIITGLPFFGVTKQSDIHKIGLNTVWLVFDRVIRMGVGLIVGIWIARYFGPDLFGTWNYAMAFIALFSTIATLGIDGIIVRELTLQPQKVNIYMGSTFGLRLISGLISALLCMILSFIFNDDNRLNFILINILSVTLLLQSLDTIDLYFQSVLKSFYTVISKGVAFIMISIIKVILIITDSSIIYFALANVLELTLSSIFLIVALRKEHIDFFSIKWAGDLAKSLFKEGWPLIVAGILVMLYLKIDQIMLKEMLNERAVGIYSAAVRISEIWYFIPMVISSSILPYLIKQRETSKANYMLTLKRIYTLFFWIALIISIFISLTSTFLIETLYGSDYGNAAEVLVIHIWAGIFVFLGVASSQFLVAESIVKVSLYRTLIGAISNIALNLLLIPKLHEVGAAYATLISYFISTFSLVFFKGCQEQCILMIKAVVPSKKLFSNE